MSFVGVQIRGSYFKHDRAITRPVLQVVAVRIAGEKGCALSCLQDFLACFRNEHHLSLQNVYELFRLGMPVPLAGPGPWGQFKLIDADLRQIRSNR
jgi:hypothetical protein